MGNRMSTSRPSSAAAGKYAQGISSSPAPQSSMKRTASAPASSSGLKKGKQADGKNLQKRNIRGLQIGNPANFQHTGHIGAGSLAAHGALNAATTLQTPSATLPAASPTTQSKPVDLKSAMAEIGAVLDIGGSKAAWQEKMLKGKDVTAAVEQSVPASTKVVASPSATSIGTAAPAPSAASISSPVTASTLGLSPAPAFVPVSSAHSKTLGRLTGHLPPPPSALHLASTSSIASAVSVKSAKPAEMSTSPPPLIHARPHFAHDRPILNGLTGASAIQEIVLPPIMPSAFQETPQGMSSTRSEVSLNEKVKFERQRTLNEIENAALPPELSALLASTADVTESSARAA